MSSVLSSQKLKLIANCRRSSNKLLLFCSELILSVAGLQAASSKCRQSQWADKWGDGFSTVAASQPEGVTLHHIWKARQCQYRQRVWTADPEASFERMGNLSAEKGMTLTVEEVKGFLKQTMRRCSWSVQSSLSLPLLVQQYGGIQTAVEQSTIDGWHANSAFDGDLIFHQKVSLFHQLSGVDSVLKTTSSLVVGAQ